MNNGYMYMSHLIERDCHLLVEDHLFNFGSSGGEHVSGSKGSLHFYRLSCIYDMHNYYPLAERGQPPGGRGGSFNHPIYDGFQTIVYSQL